MTPTRERRAGLSDRRDNRRIAAFFRVATRDAPTSQAIGIKKFILVFHPAFLIIGAGYYLLVGRKKK